MRSTPTILAPVWGFFILSVPNTTNHQYDNVLLNSPKCDPYFPYRQFRRIVFQLDNLLVCGQFLHSPNKTTYFAMILQGEDKC